MEEGGFIQGLFTSYKIHSGKGKDYVSYTNAVPLP